MDSIYIIKRTHKSEDSKRGSSGTIASLKHYCFYSLDETQYTANSGKRFGGVMHAVVTWLFRNKGLLVCFAPLPVAVMDRPAISTFTTVSLNCFFHVLSRGVGRTGVYLIDYWYLSGDLGSVRFMFSPFSYEQSCLFFPLLYCLLFHF